MQIIIRSIIAFGAILYLSSCATVFNGSYQVVNINSEPSGAVVKVNGIEQGTTPTAVRLRRQEDGHQITVSLPGYNDRHILTNSDINTTSYINFINFIGWGIDFATGSLWTIQPGYYDVTLLPKE